MSERSDDQAGAGCIVVIALICLCIGAGYEYGPAIGFASFGVALLATVIIGKLRGA